MRTSVIANGWTVNCYSPKYRLCALGSLMIAGARNVAVMSAPPLLMAFRPLANIAATFESGVQQNPIEPAESLS